MFQYTRLLIFGHFTHSYIGVWNERTRINDVTCSRSHRRPLELGLSADTKLTAVKD